MNYFQFSLLCPANLATGGTQLLHQLAAELNKHDGVNATMVYVTQNREYADDPVPDEYKCYGLPYKINRVFVANYVKNYVIFPEIYVDFIYNEAFVNCTKIIYWESVDNYFAHSTVESFHKIPRDTICLSQSEYATEFLSIAGFTNILPVSDYIDQDYLTEDIGAYEREDIVLYNPKKDLGLVRILRAVMPETKFIPLINMTKAEMIDTMRKAKLYIDFGNHPGKDRIPREAAACGCCLLVGKIGSAAYYGDMDIPRYCKCDFDFAEAKSRIEFLLSTYSNRIDEFKEYRREIFKERSRFEREVTAFVEYCKGR